MARPAGLRPAGAWLVAGSLLWWAAAVFLLPPDDFFLGDTARDEAVSIAAHDGMFRGFHLLAAAGTAAAAIGVVLLGRSMWVQRRSRLVAAAVALAGAGLLAWLAEVAVRMTVTVTRAQEVADGLRAAGDEPALGSWALFYVAALGFVTPMLCTWVLARRQVPGKRSSIALAVLVTLATAAAVATLAPSMVYQFAVLPLGLVLLLARRAPATP